MILTRVISAKMGNSNLLKGFFCDPNCNEKGFFNLFVMYTILLTLLYHVSVFLYLIRIVLLTTNNHAIYE